MSSIKEITILNELCGILEDVLSLQGKDIHLTQTTQLLGHMPEFDSLSVVTIINKLEARFGFSVEDDEINADIFTTVSSLMHYIEQKLE